MSEIDKVVVTTLIDVDPATAFEVLATEAQTWWKRGLRLRPGTGGAGVMRFEPGARGRLLGVGDEAGGSRFERRRARVRGPDARLLFGWRTPEVLPGESTQVEERFERAARGTRVTLEHRYWDALRAGHPSRRGLSSPALRSMVGLGPGNLFVAQRRQAGHAAAGKGA